MIHYSLKCAEGHGFESWFRSASAFDSLVAAGQVVCPSCGSTRVEKAPMAPALSSGQEADGTRQPEAALNSPTDPRAEALAALRREVEKNSEYVGGSFAYEARAMHSGEKPERSIHGEARADEARALLEDGVPILPLPFMPGRKLN
ncbi:MAG: DUF1178 family protein [Pseudorhodobacter sp.]